MGRVLGIVRAALNGFNVRKSGSTECRGYNIDWKREELESSTGTEEVVNVDRFCSNVKGQE